MKVFIFEFCMFLITLAWIIKWPDFSGTIGFTIVAAIFAYLASKQAKNVFSTYKKIVKKKVDE